MWEVRTRRSTPSTREGHTHHRTPSSQRPDQGPKPGSCGQGAWGGWSSVCGPRMGAATRQHAPLPRGSLSRARGHDRAASPKNKSIRSRRPSAQQGLDTCPVAQCPPTGTRPACHPLPGACHQPPPCPRPHHQRAGGGAAGGCFTAAPAPGSESWAPSRGWPVGSSAPWPCRPPAPSRGRVLRGRLPSVPAPMQAPRRTRRVLRAPA